MMSEYIKREDALQALRDVLKQKKHLRPPIYDAIDNVKAIPSADVVEVRHGRWEQDDEFVCSVCGYKMIVGGGAYNYCPNCGARMDGGGENDI